ncbi:MAG: RNA-binding protein [Elusimicrobiota bacterium]
MHIYIGNLKLKTKDDHLRKLFEKYGKVDSANVYKDIFSGMYEAMGFVEMPAKKEAQTAISELDGKTFRGTKIIVHKSREKEDDRRNKLENVSDDERRSGDDRRYKKKHIDIDSLDI